MLSTALLQMTDTAYQESMSAGYLNFHEETTPFRANLSNDSTRPSSDSNRALRPRNSTSRACFIQEIRVPYSRSITFEELQAYFHLPIAEVAKRLGICTTLLKKICRKNKIRRWPYRQIRSVMKNINTLEAAVQAGCLPIDERDRQVTQILHLKASLKSITMNPDKQILSMDKDDCETDDDFSSASDSESENVRITTVSMNRDPQPVGKLFLLQAAIDNDINNEPTSTVKRKTEEDGYFECVDAAEELTSSSSMSSVQTSEDRMTVLLNTFDTIETSNPIESAVAKPVAMPKRRRKEPVISPVPEPKRQYKKKRVTESSNAQDSSSSKSKTARFDNRSSLCCGPTGASLLQSNIYQVSRLVPPVRSTAVVDWKVNPIDCGFQPSRISYEVQAMHVSFSTVFG